MRIFQFIVALATAAGLSAQAAFQITAPANGSTVSPLKPMQRALALMTEEQLDTFINQEMVDRMADVTTYPAGIDLEWSQAEGAAAYEIRVADNAELANCIRERSTKLKCALYNLEIGKTYFLQIAAVDKAGKVLEETQVQSFTVENLPPRVLNIPGVPNVRDLGGRVGLEGRVVPQGMIFRSAAFNDNSPDGGKTVGKTRINDQNRTIAVETLKLKTEIDLRWDSELADMAASPLGPQVQYERHPSTLYSTLFTPEGYANYLKLFTIFTKAENYPVDFHCILGADRTGSLAAVLLATLGVSREEIIRDYCFTSLYTPFLRPPRNIRIVLDGLAKCGHPGDSLSDQAMRYLMRCGVKSNQIYDFLTIVLGPGLQMPKILAEAKLMEDVKDRFQLPLSGLTVAPFVVRQETMLQAGAEVSWHAPVWTESPLVAGNSDANGAVLLQLRNATPTATTLQLQPNLEQLTASAYFVLAPQTKLAYCAPNGGLRWKPIELKQFRTVLDSQEELMLVIQPTTPQIEAGYTAIPWQDELTFIPYHIEAEAIDAPIIDGQLDDTVWQAIAPHSLCDVNGAPIPQNAPRIWLATDKDHGTLYLAAKIHDETPCAEVHSERDAALWEEDSIELFLASFCEAKFYQLILNAEGCVWDGVDGKADAWTAVLECKTARTKDGWTLEAAIPLAQFGFSGAMEINVCANDNPDHHLFNLFPTQGSFKNRAAICPVLLK